ncbi:MAG: hypothetical protein Pars2KO_02450 [Parasphingorhabdus sp.]
MAEVESLLTPKLLDALYTEAMILADEARSYFESGRFDEETGTDSNLSVSFSCESLKVTTRLMHCIAWLLNQKALHEGDLSEGEAWNRDRELGYAAASDGPMVDLFPEDAQRIIVASEDLFQRLQRMSARMEQQSDEQPVVHELIARLQNSF